MSLKRNQPPTGGIWTLRPEDPRWPALWRELKDPPPWVRGAGDPEALREPALAIVGTRRASPRGLAIARRLAADLARTGWTIVSGLALGIDAAAHAGALEAGGRTVAVMASGANRTYPARHVSLRREIEAAGCTVSEVEDDAAPLPYLFPRRNRLVSGLTQGVIVVEAPHKSGAMITARQAVDQNREIFAVPGPVDDDRSRGCHHLLREGAHLVESVKDVHDVLTPPMAEGEILAAAVGELLPLAGSSARWIWDRLDLTGLRLSELRGRWAGTEAVWHEGLLALEMAGLIARLPGGMIARRIWIP